MKPIPILLLLAPMASAMLPGALTGAKLEAQVEDLGAPAGAGAEAEGEVGAPLGLIGPNPQRYSIISLLTTMLPARALSELAPGGEVAQEAELEVPVGRAGQALINQ